MAASKRYLRRLLRIIRDNLVGAASVALALYIIVRGQFSSYTAQDIPFLLAVTVGLIGLNAVDGFIERKVRLAEIGAQSTGARVVAERTGEDLANVRDELVRLNLAVSAIRSGAGASQLLSDQQEIPREAFRRARRIYWSGVTLRVSLRQHLDDLRVALQHGSDLNLLVTDPASAELKTELTLREGARADYIDGVLKSTQLNLQVLAQYLPPGESYSLGFHPVYPTYGLTIINPDEDDGICYVELYHAKNRRGAIFVVHATQDSKWFKFFVDQFDELSKRARVHRITTAEDVERAVEGDAAHGA